MGHDRRKYLFDNDEYWYKLDLVSLCVPSVTTAAHPAQPFQHGEAVRNFPFLNPALQAILRDGLFKGRTSLYSLFPNEFKGYGDEREMPAVLIALAATFVRYVPTQRAPKSHLHPKLHMALDDWVNHSGPAAWDYNGSSIAEVYLGHLDELKRIMAEKPTSYHAILRKFFLNCA